MPQPLARWSNTLPLCLLKNSLILMPSGKRDLLILTLYSLEVIFLQTTVIPGKSDKT